MQAIEQAAPFSKSDSSQSGMDFLYAMVQERGTDSPRGRRWKSDSDTEAATMGEKSCCRMATVRK